MKTLHHPLFDYIRPGSHMAPLCALSRAAGGTCASLDDLTNSEALAAGAEGLGAVGLERANTAMRSGSTICTG